MTESYWTIPTEIGFTPPITIPREQALALTEKTNGVLEGVVKTNTVGTEIYIAMSIRAPLLNNYRVEILRYEQPIKLYPGELYFYLPEDQRMTVHSEDQFRRTIRSYLSSNEITTVLESLIAQS
jgi:hypothetical protein